MSSIEISVEAGKAESTLDLIKVLAEHYNAPTHTHLVVKVETSHKGMLDLVSYLARGEKALVEGPAMKKALAVKKHGSKVEPLAPWPPPPPPDGEEPKIVGYCRDCTQPIHAGKKGNFCSQSCGNRYSVKRVYLKKKGMALDELVVYRLPEKDHSYTSTEEEFSAKLHAGTIPEGTRAVTPKGTLKVVVFQGGRLTTNEYFPSVEEVA